MHGLCAAKHTKWTKDLVIIGSGYMSYAEFKTQIVVLSSLLSVQMLDYFTGKQIIEFRVYRHNGRHSYTVVPSDNMGQLHLWYMQNIIDLSCKISRHGFTDNVSNHIMPHI